MFVRLYTAMLWAGESEELQFSSEVMAAINETAYNYAGTLWGFVGGAWWVGLEHARLLCPTFPHTRNIGP